MLYLGAVRAFAPEYNCMHVQNSCCGKAESKCVAKEETEEEPPNNQDRRRDLGFRPWGLRNDILSVLVVCRSSTWTFPGRDGSTSSLALVLSKPYKRLRAAMRCCRKLTSCPTSPLTVVLVVFVVQRSAPLLNLEQNCHVPRRADFGGVNKKTRYHWTTTQE